MISMEKKAYFSDRTLKIIKKFDYTEPPMIDQLIAYFYVLDDAARKDVFEYLKIMRKNHCDPKRYDDLKKWNDIIYSHQFSYFTTLYVDLFALKIIGLRNYKVC